MDHSMHLCKRTSAKLFLKELVGALCLDHLGIKINPSSLTITFNLSLRGFKVFLSNFSQYHLNQFYLQQLLFLLEIHYLFGIQAKTFLSL